MDIVDAVVGLVVAVLLITAVALPIITSQAAELTGTNATILTQTGTILVVVILVLAANMMRK